MYLLLIFVLIWMIPLFVMPGDILAGRASPYYVVLKGALAVCVGVLILFMIAAIAGQGVFAQMADGVKTISEAAAADPTIIKAFQLSEVDQGERAKMFMDAYNVMLEQLPAYILAAGAISSYVEYMILSRGLRRKPSVKPLPKLREFSFSRNGMLGIIGMYLVAWILSTFGTKVGTALYVNMNFIFDFAFSLQGLSVVLMFFHVKRMPKIIGFFLALIMWISVIGRMCLIVLGMLDMIFGLKLRIQAGPAARK